MLTNIYYRLWKLKERFLEKMVLKKMASLVTMIGNGHYCSSQSVVKLCWGSTKYDVVFLTNCQIFGEILSYNHGKVSIGEWSQLGINSVINCVNSIEIGDDVMIAAHCIIVDHNYHPINPVDRKILNRTPHGSWERAPMCSLSAPIKIENNVWLGNYVRICKGVTIGENSIIGANSVVTKDIPANCIAVGNPARVVKENIDKFTMSVLTNRNYVE